MVSAIQEFVAGARFCARCNALVALLVGVWDSLVLVFLFYFSFLFFCLLFHLFSRVLLGFTALLSVFS